MNPLVKPTMGLVSRLAPGIAARWFESFMLNPNSPRGPATFSVQSGAETRHLPFEGGHLSVTSWGSGPLVAAVHGWGARASVLDPLIGPVLAAGFRVVALDLPAHGSSSGTRTDVMQCARAISAVFGDAGSVHGAVVHSFGGPSIGVAVHMGLPVQRVAMIGCPASMYDLALELGANLGFTRRAGELMAVRLARRLQMPWGELRTGTLLASRAVRGLVIHDRRDRVVPFHHAQEIVDDLEDVDLMATVGLGHRGVLLDPGVSQRIVEFFAR